MENENIPTEQIYRTLMIIWFALFMSQFIFLVVIFVVKPQVFQFDLAKPVLGENAIIILAFAMFAFLNLIISFVMKKNLLNNSIKHQKPALVQTATIIACALCESISIFGFVLAFVFDYQYFFLWFIVGIVGMIFHFPKRESLHLATYQKSQKF